MINNNNNTEATMTNKKITLTDLEKKVAQKCIDITDGLNATSFEWLNPSDFGIDSKSLKGVFGSLVKKGLLYTDGDSGSSIEYAIYYWTVNVESDEYGRLIYDIDGLLKHFAHYTQDSRGYEAWLEVQD